jgi:DNA-binding transcriptional LysR family regulator
MPVRAMCAAVTFAWLRIVPKMKTFLARHPELDVDVVLDDRHIDLLEQGVTAAEGVRAAVLADMGVAVASEWMFGPELASGEVRAVLTEQALPAVDLWAVFPTRRMASAKARAFTAFFEEAPGAGGTDSAETSAPA